MDNEEELTFEGRWCVHSETGDHFLIDLKTGKLLLRKKANGQVVILGEINDHITESSL